MYFEVYEGADNPGGQKGKWRWHLWADNGNKIATSGEGYVNRSECEKMIKHIQEGCPKAGVYKGDGKGVSKASRLLGL